MLQSFALSVLRQFASMGACKQGPPEPCMFQAISRGEGQAFLRNALAMNPVCSLGRQVDSQSTCSMVLG